MSTSKWRLTKLSESWFMEKQDILEVGVGKRGVWGPDLSVEDRPLTSRGSMALGMNAPSGRPGSVPHSLSGQHRAGLPGTANAVDGLVTWTLLPRHPSLCSCTGWERGHRQAGTCWDCTQAGCLAPASGKNGVRCQAWRFPQVCW